MLAPTVVVVRLTLHVLAAAVWVGGQVVMTGLVGPARGLGPDAPKTLAGLSPASPGRLSPCWL